MTRWFSFGASPGLQSGEDVNKPGPVGDLSAECGLLADMKAPDGS